MAKTKVSARLEMFSDREFLQIVADLADNEGWADTEEIAQRIFPAEMNNGSRLNAISAVSVRLAWMRRFGVVEKDTKERKRWMLTSKGQQFARRSFDKRLAARIEDVTEEKLLEMTHIVAARLQSSDPVSVKMMRREWRYNELQLPRGGRSS